MIRYHASWVLPISQAPIRGGWVEVADGRVVACGPSGSTAERVRPSVREVDLGQVALMPGLVNAHTHLELSYLRGRVPAASSFVSWIRGVMAARQAQSDPRASLIVDAIDTTIAEAVSTGTAVVGDISNTLVPFARLLRSSLAGVVFYELIRFRAPDAPAIVARARQEMDGLEPSGRIRLSLAAHAPYSVDPALFRAIRAAVGEMEDAPCSVHLSESIEEVDFIQSAGGPWRHLLEELGAWNPEWQAPAVSPVRYFDDNGFLHDRLLAVHGVQMTASDLQRLRARGTTLVTCPRSNRYTGVGAPPIEAFYASGVSVAVGTDSLASAPDLNIFSELAAMRAAAPQVPASTLLASATREGARALGFDREYGTIEPGKTGRLLAVDVPEAVGDVEEYLVSGILPEHVRWIE